MKHVGTLCLVALLAVACNKAPASDPDAPVQETTDKRIPVGTWISDLPDHPVYEFAADMHYKESHEEGGKQVEYSGTYTIFGDTITMTRTSMPKMGEEGYNSEAPYNFRGNIEFIDSKHMKMHFGNVYIPFTKK